MQQFSSQRDKLFDLIWRLLGGEEKAWGLRLVSATEIATRLLRHDEAKLLIRIWSQGPPDMSPEQLAGELVVSLAESAIRSDSEWYPRVAAVQVEGEWFLRFKKQDIAIHKER